MINEKANPNSKQGIHTPEQIIFVLYHNAHGTQLQTLGTYC